MLLIGCGGVAHAVATSTAPSLQKIGLIDIVSGKAKSLKQSLLSLNSEFEITDLTDPASLCGYDVIYDATGSGKIGKTPLQENAATDAYLFIDAVYTPEITPFLEQGLARHAKTINGLSHMLASTALHCSIITGKQVSLHKVHDIYMLLKAET
jgi:shikimate 5-dehydrogenase